MVEVAEVQQESGDQCGAGDCREFCGRYSRFVSTAW